MGLKGSGSITFAVVISARPCALCMLYELVIFHFSCELCLCLWQGFLSQSFYKFRVCFG